MQVAPTPMLAEHDSVGAVHVVASATDSAHTVTPVSEASRSTLTPSPTREARRRLQREWEARYRDYRDHQDQLTAADHHSDHLDLLVEQEMNAYVEQSLEGRATEALIAYARVLQAVTDAGDEAGLAEARAAFEAQLN